MKAALFDLDGTLIESMGVWDEVCREFLMAKGIKMPGDLGPIIKNMSFAESADYFITRFSLETTRSQLIDEWNAMAYREYAERIGLKGGARRIVERFHAQGIRLAVVTATDRDLTEVVLRRHALLPFFPVIVTVGETGLGKENPDIFLRTAQMLEVYPADCVVLEDSLHAVKGAKKAGMKVWGVYDPFSADEETEIEQLADGYVRSFDELPEDL